MKKVVVIFGVVIGLGQLYLAGVFLLVDGPSWHWELWGIGTFLTIWTAFIVALCSVPMTPERVEHFIGLTRRR